MRRAFIVNNIVGVVILLALGASSSLAQQDKLVGRWEGKVQSLQGERPSTLIFKKEGETYVGRTTGLRHGTEVQLKDVKIDGNKITAKSDVETPQATVTINYSFTLEGETMKGQGALDFGGQSITFNIDLKRVSNDTDAPLVFAQQQTQTTQRLQRPVIEQPQQKQSLDYFAGQWSFKYLGRESALWPAPREGVLTLTKNADGKSLTGTIEGKHDGGTYKENWLITFDDASKSLNFSEKLASGATVTSRGDWSSPISIRFAVEPVKVKGSALQLRRTISIVSAHSFTVAEELAEDGGPFVRLGSAVFTKIGAK
jgi:hypothetical protein